VGQQHFSDRTPYRADAARRAGDQNGTCHVSVCVLLLTQRVPVWTKRWGEIPQPSDEYALRAV
jgi:hypothetical protein